MSHGDNLESNNVTINVADGTHALFRHDVDNTPNAGAIVRLERPHAGLPTGFPEIQLDGHLFGPVKDPAKAAENEGFHQKSPHEAEGIIPTIKEWFGLGHKETVEDDLRKQLYDNLPPEKRAELDRELQQQHDDWVRDTTMMSLTYEPPQRSYPAIDEFNKMVKDQEDAISKKVLDGMSDEDKRRLQQDEAEYYRYEEPHGLYDPNQHRTPGPMLQEYWRRLSEETERRVQTRA
jgi:hypothetical protein